MTRRIIKFRFWCEAAKGFVQDYNYNGAVDDLFNDEDPLLFPTQYTGCNDYQKKEIWEGDVIEFEKTFVGEVETPRILKAVIEYREARYIARIINSEFTLTVIDLDAFYNSYKFTNILRVIGNRFENPELLK
jgi:uncharacterized phage protein (TIGR01671 family)